jgi:hypothetical protein
MQLSDKEGRHYKFRMLEFWAHHGRVQVIDYRIDPPEHKSEALRDFLLRAQGLILERERVRFAPRSSAGSSSNLVAAEEVAELQRCIEGMVACAREAKAQGDPHDPGVQQFVRNHVKRSILLPTPGQTIEINKPGRLTRNGVLPADN